jgi:hypothetical protein
MNGCVVYVCKSVNICEEALDVVKSYVSISRFGNSLARKGLNIFYSIIFPAEGILVPLNIAAAACNHYVSILKLSTMKEDRCPAMLLLIEV